MKKSCFSCGTILEWDNQILWMINCGEGMQLCFLNNSLNFNKLHCIFITQLHSSHLFGLTPFLSLCMYKKSNLLDPLYIIGPKGIKHFLMTNFQLTDTYFSKFIGLHFIEWDSLLFTWDIFSFQSLPSFSLKHFSKCTSQKVKPMESKTENEKQRQWEALVTHSSQQLFHLQSDTLRTDTNPKTKSFYKLSFSLLEHSNSYQLVVEEWKEEMLDLDKMKSILGQQCLSLIGNSQLSKLLQSDSSVTSFTVASKEYLKKDFSIPATIVRVILQEPCSIFE